MPTTLLNIFNPDERYPVFWSLAGAMDVMSLMNLTGSCRQFKGYRTILWKPLLFLMHWIPDEECRRDFLSAMSVGGAYISGGALLHFVQRTSPGKSDLDVFTDSKPVRAGLARLLLAAGAQLIKKGQNPGETDGSGAFQHGGTGVTGDVRATSDSSNSSEDAFEPVGSERFDFLVRSVTVLWVRLVQG